MFADVRAEEVLRNPPAIYEEKLKSMLTPLEEVLKYQDLFTSEDGKGVLLLDEDIDYVDEQGRYYSVEHTVYRGLTEAGSEALGKDVFYFRKSDQKIYLIKAQTILPDGTRREVQPNAAFLKNPQDGADDALYDDGCELIVMYPNVGVGATTEAIVLKEQEKFRMPGEYTRRFSWGANWPRQNVREVVELPNGLADRLKITNLGDGVPQVKKEALPGNRTRLIWEKQKISSDSPEADPQPVYQSGPYTSISTLEDWNSLARWYAGLAKGRDTLEPALAASVDDWTKDAKSPREIIDILTEKVVREVRYVGLEFGLAGYQPNDCNLVWNNRYGDCKDKANLLRAMLVYKGIPANLVLLETDHAGVPEKRSPDFRQFDHMIVRASDAPGKWILIDPTIRYGRPGLLVSSDADRDVLVLEGETCEWVRTPATTAGNLTYDFDLRRDEHGDLRGWATMRATDYYAVSFYGDFLGKDRQSAIQEAGDALRGFFPSAEVVDVKTTGDKLEGGSFGYKAYLVVPAGGQDASPTVKMAFHRSMIPDVAGDDKRQTPLFLWKDVVETKLRLELSAGVAPSDIPSPFGISTPNFAANGSWMIEGNTLKGALRIEIKDSLVAPAGYQVFKNAINSFQTWVDRPVILGPAGGQPVAAKPTATPDEVDAENFPLMPTAEGQRDLLEKTFPSEGNLDLRRKALARIQQYFPNDKETGFYAGMNLAQMDAEAQKYQPAAEAMEKLIGLYRNSVGASWIVWAEYWLAFVYMECDKAKAQQVFTKIYENPAANNFRKGWSYYYAAKLNDSPETAIELLRQGVTVDSEALGPQLVLLAGLLAEKGQLDSLETTISQVASLPPERGEDALARLALSSSDLSPEREKELQEMLGSVAEKSPRVKDAIKTARAKSDARVAWKKIKDDLRQYVATHPGAVDPADQKKPVDAIQKEIDQAINASDSRKSVALTLALLLNDNVGDGFPEALWRAASRAEWLERQNGAGSSGPLLSFLLGLCAEAPKSHDVYHEGRFVEARSLKLRKDYGRIEKLLSDTLADPEFNRDYEISFRLELGEALEKQGKTDAALAAYLPLKERIAGNADACMGLLRAVLVNLREGKWDDAVALLNDLGRVPEKVRQKVDASFQLEDMISLAKDPDAARGYWTASAALMKDWQSLMVRQFSDSEISRPVEVPVIWDIYDLKKSIGNAARSGNRSSLGESLNLMISAAQWSPAVAREACGISETFTSLFSKARPNEVNEFFLALIKAQPESNGRERDIYLAGLLYDLGRPREAIPLIRKVLSDGTRDELNHGMRRIWGIVGYQVKEERPGAMAALEESLAMPDGTVNRALTVNILAQLYEMEGRTDDEITLLRRELQHPDVKGAALYAELQRREKNASNEAGSAREFDAYLKAWMAKHKPSWYDYANPQEIDQARLGDIAAVISTPEHYFKAPEIVKFQMLAAQDEKIPSAERMTAWEKAWGLMADFQPWNSDLASSLHEALDDKRLPEDVKLNLLWAALYEWGTRFQKERFDKAAASPLVDGFADAYKKETETLRLVAGTDPLKVESLEKNFYQLCASPVTNVAQAGMYQMYAGVLRLGDLDAAERMYNQLDQVSIAPGADGSIPALKLEYLKLLKNTRKWLPMANALREATLKCFSPELIRRPANYGDLREPGNSDLSCVNNAREILLYRISNHLVDASDLEFWEDFSRRLDVEKYSDLRRELAAIMIEKAPDDQGRAAAVMGALDVIDLDDAGDRAAIMAVGEKYQDASLHPLTARSLYLLGAKLAFRSGDAALYEQKVVKNGASKNLQKIDIAAVRFYLAVNDGEKLKDAISQVPVETLMAPENVSSAIEAYDAAGLGDEADIARDEGRKVLYSLVLQAWLSPDVSTILGAVDLANVLGDPQGLPEAWVQDMMERVKDDYPQVQPYGWSRPASEGLG